MEDVADINRGITTGSNEFFYLNHEDLDKWNIESEYIVPVIKSSQQSKHTHPEKSELDLSLFYCNMSKQRLTGTNARKYIEWGEESEIQPDKNGKPKEIRRFDQRPTTKTPRDGFLWVNGKMHH